MNPFFQALLAAVQAVQSVSTALSVNQVSSNTIYWATPYKSSQWPMFSTTKDYFVLWGTEHDGGNGGIWWGEFDNFDGQTLNGFIERGLIIDGLSDPDGIQVETPNLITIPTSKSGLVSDTVFLYYHIYTGIPSGDGENYQETKLITTSGGADLHTSTWTDRGKPLGLYNDDDHTGYCRVFERADGSYVAHHLGRNSTGGVESKMYISESTTGLNFTRVKQIDVNIDGSIYRYARIVPFVRNSILYGFIDLYMEGQIAIAELDLDFLPISIVKTVLNYPDSRDLNGYIEGDTAYLLLKSGTAEDNTGPYELFIYDLTNV